MAYRKMLTKLRSLQAGYSKEEEYRAQIDLKTDNNFAIYSLFIIDKTFEQPTTNAPDWRFFLNLALIALKKNGVSNVMQILQDCKEKSQANIIFFSNYYFNIDLDWYYIN